MGSEAAARWKDPLYAHEGDASDANPVGQIEVATGAGARMPSNTQEMFTYGCCEGGSWFDGTYGCCQ